MIEIIVAIIGGVALVLSGWAQVGFRKQLKLVGEDARQAKEQTTNEHKTNLRDDIDALGEQVRGVNGSVAELKGDVASLHTDVRILSGAVKDAQRMDDALEDTIERRRVESKQAVEAVKEELLAKIRAL